MSGSGSREGNRLSSGSELRGEGAGLWRSGVSMSGALWEKSKSYSKTEFNVW